MGITYFPVKTFPERWFQEHYWPDVGTSTGVAVTNSMRWQIVDAVKNALSSSTGIGSVSDKREPWWDFNPTQMPHVFVVENTEERSRFSFPDSVSDDMHALLNLNIEGYCYSNTDDQDDVRMALIRDIEVAIQNSTSVKDVTWEIVPTDVTADKGVIDNYCLVHCKYRAEYLYNHVNG
jgi:uncharacterized protein YuzB (UPF0349 family)